MKILVTGATGFIGSRIVETLVSLPQHEVSFTGRTQPKDSILMDRGARFYAGDLIDQEYCSKVVQDCDAIIHCAGLAGTWGAYQKYYQANVVSTQNLLNAARRNSKAHSKMRFINISSPSIYFAYKDQLNLSESETPDAFSNAYAQTKFEAEQLVLAYHSELLETVSLRPRSVIGKGDQNVLPRLIQLQRAGGLIQVGSGQNIVDITTVGNLIEAVMLCLNAPSAAMGETYNITNGEPELFWGFVERVLRAAHLSTSRRRLPYSLVMPIAQMNELFSAMLGKKKEPALLPISVGIIAFSMTLNIEKAKRNLGYIPVYSTQDGIDEFFRNMPTD